MRLRRIPSANLEREIRVQPSQLDPFASTAYKYSPNSFEIYFLKHQDSFNSFNSCSKNKIRVQK